MVDRQRLGRNNKIRGAQEERNVLALLESYFGETFTRVGNRGTSSADVESETVVVEVKSRQSSSWRLLRDAWAQIEIAAEETGKEPWLVISNIDSRRRVRWLVTKLPEVEKE